MLMHSAFWLIYLLQDTVLEIVWVGPALKNIPENVQFWMAFKAAIAAWVPKLLFFLHEAVGDCRSSGSSIPVNGGNADGLQYRRSVLCRRVRQ